MLYSQLSCIDSKLFFCKVHRHVSCVRGRPHCLRGGVLGYLARYPCTPQCTKCLIFLLFTTVHTFDAPQSTKRVAFFFSSLLLSAQVTEGPSAQSGVIQILKRLCHLLIPNHTSARPLPACRMTRVPRPFPSEKETTLKVSKTLAWKPRLESGLDGLICAIFARLRHRITWHPGAHTERSVHALS